MNKKQSEKEEKKEKSAPVFTGNYIRDNVVSDTEKAAEVSQAIYENLTKRSVKKKNERKI